MPSSRGDRTRLEAQRAALAQRMEEGEAQLITLRNLAFVATHSRRLGREEPTIAGQGSTFAPLIEARELQQDELRLALLAVLRALADEVA